MRNSVMLKHLMSEVDRLNESLRYKERGESMLAHQKETQDKYEAILSTYLPEHHIVYKNIRELSKSISSLVLAYKGCSDPLMKQQFLSNIRRIISLINEETTVSKLSSVYEHSRVWQQTGVELHVSGIEALILMLVGYTLIETKSEARVRMNGPDILYRFASVGRENKTPVSSKESEGIDVFMERDFILSDDRSDKNSALQDDALRDSLIDLQGLYINQALEVNISTSRNQQVRSYLYVSGNAVMSFNTKEDIELTHIDKQNGIFYDKEGTEYTAKPSKGSVFDIIKVLRDNSCEVYNFTPFTRCDI